MLLYRLVHISLFMTDIWCWVFVCCQQWQCPNSSVCQRQHSVFLRHRAMLCGNRSSRSYDCRWCW